LNIAFWPPWVNLRFSPTVAVAELALLQIVVWTLVPRLMHYSPPLDVVESYLWAHEWMLSTYKHPALPSWVLEVSRLLTGAVDWPPYLVSQLFVVTTWWLVFRLGKDLMDEQRAAVGTLLLVGIAYFSWRSIEFNHNVAQCHLVDLAGDGRALRIVVGRSWHLCGAWFLCQALYGDTSGARSAMVFSRS
jgi:4-amino-4-deoxy-L-arabinose transferase-like glycosyltransferase